MQWCCVVVVLWQWCCGSGVVWCEYDVWSGLVPSKEGFSGVEEIKQLASIDLEKAAHQVELCTHTQKLQGFKDRKR